jgi:hypothetical protein
MDRREFLGVAAVAGVGPVLLGPDATSKPKPVVIRGTAIDPADYPPDPRMAKMLEHYHRRKDEEIWAALRM